MKKKQKTAGIIILHMCTKNYDHIMYASWDKVHNRWMDRQMNRWTDGPTDRQKKWHIEVGVPPKKNNFTKENQVVRIAENLRAQELMTKMQKFINKKN